MDIQKEPRMDLSQDKYMLHMVDKLSLEIAEALADSDHNGTGFAHLVKKLQKVEAINDKIRAKMLANRILEYVRSM